MKTISWILLFSMIFYCCTSTHMVMRSQSAYDELNEKVEGKKGKITLMNGDIVAVENINIGIDSTSWVETKWEYSKYMPRSKASSNCVVPTSDIKKIATINHGQGALQGIRYGAISGLIVGAIMGLVVSKDAQPIKLFGIPWPGGDDIKAETSKETKRALIILVNSAIGGILGVILGLSIGAIIGYKDKYVFDVPADSTYNDIEVEN